MKPGGRGDVLVSAEKNLSWRDKSRSRKKSQRDFDLNTLGTWTSEPLAEQENGFFWGGAGLQSFCCQQMKFCFCPKPSARQRPWAPRAAQPCSPDYDVVRVASTGRRRALRALRGVRHVRHARSAVGAELES